MSSILGSLTSTNSDGHLCKIAWILTQPQIERRLEHVQTSCHTEDSETWIMYIVVLKLCCCDSGCVCIQRSLKVGRCRFETGHSLDRRGEKITQSGVLVGALRSEDQLLVMHVSVNRQICTFAIRSVIRPVWIQRRPRIKVMNALHSSSKTHPYYGLSAKPQQDLQTNLQPRPLVSQYTESRALRCRIVRDE